MALEDRMRLVDAIGTLLKDGPNSHDIKGICEAPGYAHKDLNNARTVHNL